MESWEFVFRGIGWLPQRRREYARIGGKQNPPPRVESARAVLDQQSNWCADVSTARDQRASWVRARQARRRELGGACSGQGSSDVRTWSYSEMIGSSSTNLYLARLIEELDDETRRQIWEKLGGELVGPEARLASGAASERAYGSRMRDLEADRIQTRAIVREREDGGSERGGVGKNREPERRRPRVDRLLPSAGVSVEQGKDAPFPYRVHSRSLGRWPQRHPGVRLGRRCSSPRALSPDDGRLVVADRPRRRARQGQAARGVLQGSPLRAPLARTRGPEAAARRHLPRDGPVRRPALCLSLDSDPSADLYASPRMRRMEMAADQVRLAGDTKRSTLPAPPRIPR